MVVAFRPLMAVMADLGAVLGPARMHGLMMRKRETRRGGLGDGHLVPWACCGIGEMMHRFETKGSHGSLCLLLFAGE